jgi:hypothetical protein
VVSKRYRASRKTDGNTSTGGDGRETRGTPDNPSRRRYGGVPGTRSEAARRESTVNARRTRPGITRWTIRSERTPWTRRTTTPRSFRPGTGQTLVFRKAIRVSRSRPLRHRFPFGSWTRKGPFGRTLLSIGAPMQGRLIGRNFRPERDRSSSPVQGWNSSGTTDREMASEPLTTWIETGFLSVMPTIAL